MNYNWRWTIYRLPNLYAQIIGLYKKAIYGNDQHRNAIDNMDMKKEGNEF